MIGDAPTERQAQVLAFIAGYLEQAGFPPTLREIGEALGIASTNGVVDHLKALEKKGLIKREPLGSRSIRILKPGAAAAPQLPNQGAELRLLRSAIAEELARLEALGPALVEKMERHEASFGLQARSSLLFLRRLAQAVPHGEATDG